MVYQLFKYFESLSPETLATFIFKICLNICLVDQLSHEKSLGYELPLYLLIMFAVYLVRFFLFQDIIYITNYS